MEFFAKLYSSLLVFVYHCFDRIVIHGYLSGLSRPEQVVYFFREVLGIPVVGKEVLSRRTDDYRSWVEAYTRNHDIPILWAENGVRKEHQSYPLYAVWRRPMLTESILSSKAWSWARPSGSALLGFRLKTQTIASRRSSGDASCITTFMSGTRFWGLLSCASPACFPSRPLIGSTVAARVPPLGGPSRHRAITSVPGHQAPA